MSRHRAAHLDEIGAVNPEWEPSWKSIRHHLGLRAFGANATVGDFGDRVLEPHTEATTGDEEVYLVLRGAGRFTVDEAEFDAAAGTLVWVEPAAFREATAQADRTVVLMVGARAGAVYAPPDWDGGGGPDPVHEGDAPRPGRRDGHRIVHADEVASGAGWQRLGDRLGVRSLGIAARAGGEGDQLVDGDPEDGSAELLYVVVAGDVSFTVEDEPVDAPAGTFVLVEPGARRAAVSTGQGTLLVAFDGVPGRAYPAPAAETV